MKVKRFGILTGGGDCPGLNAAIRSITKSLILDYDANLIGFLDGFQGLVFNRFIDLTYDTVSNILTEGGTILGTSNRDNFFGVKRNESQRNEPVENRIADALHTWKELQLDGLFCIGGDGTLTVANYLSEHGIPIVGIPKTIDNDVSQTDLAIGFDTAVMVATESIDRIHTTATSHGRIMVVEVMGRSAGWIALHAGIAGGGDVILIPEIPFDMDHVTQYIRDRFKRGRKSCIIVVAEGAYEKGKIPVWKKRSRGLSGIAITLSRRIEESTGIETRSIILGHLQRGGTPTSQDRVLATLFGYKAVQMAVRKNFGKMVCLNKGKIDFVPLKDVSGRPRRVPQDHPLLKAARSVGTCFGD